MKALQEVFGRVENPAISAAQLLDEAVAQKEEQLQDTKGEVISFLDLRNQMNVVSRSFISLGLIAGDRVLIHALDYRNALLVYLAAEQIGVNVVNLGEQPLEAVSFDAHRGRMLIADRLGDCFLSTKAAHTGCEFLVQREAGLEPMNEDILSWEAFLRLSRYATDWELRRFRVIEG